MYSHVMIYVFLNYFSFYYMNHNTQLILWLFYVLVPLIDMIAKPDTENLTHSVSKDYEKDKRFLIPLYLFFFNDYINFFWALYQFTYANFSGSLHRFVFIFSQSHFAALGLTVGHELLHRKEVIHKICGTLAYSKVLYSHFFIEHTKGHHKNVATPMDPATSRIGESLYRFLPRTFIGGYK